MVESTTVPVRSGEPAQSTLYPILYALYATCILGHVACHLLRKVLSPHDPGYHMTWNHTMLPSCKAAIGRRATSARPRPRWNEWTIRPSCNAVGDATDGSTRAARV